MKFTSKLAATALVLAMSATTALAVSPTYQPIVDQFAKINQLTLDKNARTEANISDETYNVLKRVIKDDFPSMSYDAKVAFLNKTRTTYEQLASSSTNPESEATKFAKQVVEVLKDPAQVIAQEEAIERTVRGEKELPIEQEKLVPMLTTVPVNESHIHFRAAQALDSQLHFDLLGALNQVQGERAAFALVNGTAASGNDLTVNANQFVAGYKMHFEPRQVFDVAFFANGVMDNTQRDLGGANFTTGVTNYGAGFYTKVTEQALKLSGLFTFNKGTQNLDANADFTSLINGLLDKEYQKKFAGSERNQTPVTADTTTTNLVLKGEYTFRVYPGLFVTPGVAYHYHTFTANNQTITDKSKTFGSTEVLSMQTPFMPEISQHGVGGTLDVVYKLRENISLGADASVMYYSGNTYNSAYVTIINQEVPVAGTGTTETKQFVHGDFEEKSTSYLNANVAAKASWDINDNFTLGAKVGYSYFSELSLNGVNYNVNLGFKF